MMRSLPIRPLEDDDMNAWNGPIKSLALSLTAAGGVGLRNSEPASSGSLPDIVAFAG